MSDERIHQTPGETRERTYERLRRSGITPDNARRISEDAARQAHDNLNRDRRDR